MQKKSDTSTNWGYCNHLRIIQKIPEQHIEKAQSQKTTDNSHIGY